MRHLVAGLRTGAIAALAIALASCAAWAAAPAPQKLPPGNRRLLAGSYRRPVRHGWIYVHLQGSPRQLGYQNGYLLAPEIARVLRGFHVTMPRETKKSWAWLHHAAMHMMLPHIPRQYVQELRGIAEGLAARGVHADLGDVIILNAFEEMPEYYVPWYDAQHHEPKVARLVAPGNCSAFVATGSYTKDGKIVIGHNNWTSYFPGEDWNIIYDIVPDHGLHILMDGFPGVITSDDDFGINSAGLMVTETTISQFFGYDPNGIPEFVRSREALQYAHNISQWIAIMMKGNNGGYANDWLLGDRKTNEIARVELGLTHQEIWRTKNGMYVGSNFASDPALIKTETTGFNPHDLASSPNARHLRWDQLRRKYKGKIDIAIAEKMESDDYDVIEHKIDPDERTLCGHNDLSPRGVKIWGWPPYWPGGTVQAKVTDSAMAAKMEIEAAMGHPDGIGFNAPAFFQAHPQYDWQKPFLRSMPSHPWTEFQATGY